LKDGTIPTNPFLTYNPKGKVRKENPVISTVTSKGQITIPVEIRRAAGLSAGSQVEFIVNRHAHIEMVPLQSGLHGLRGALQNVSMPTDSRAQPSPDLSTARPPQAHHPASGAVGDPPQSRYPVALKP